MWSVILPFAIYFFTKLLKNGKQRSLIFTWPWCDPGISYFLYINWNDLCFGKNNEQIVNLYICIYQGSPVYRGKFTTGCTGENCIKKVANSAVKGKLPSHRGNPTTKLPLSQSASHRLQDLCGRSQEMYPKSINKSRSKGDWTSIVVIIIKESKSGPS